MLKHCQHYSRQHWKYMVVMGWETGMRQGDICTLKKDAVNHATKSITFIASKTERTNPALTLPLSDMAYELVANLMRRSRHPYIDSETAARYIRNSKALCVKFRRFLEGADIFNKSFHSFRYSMVLRLLERGYQPLFIKTITGQSVETLQDYANVSLEAKRKALSEDHNLSIRSSAEIRGCGIVLPEHQDVQDIEQVAAIQ